MMGIGRSGTGDLRNLSERLARLIHSPSCIHRRWSTEIPGTLSVAELKAAQNQPGRRFKPRNFLESAPHQVRQEVYDDRALDLFVLDPPLCQLFGRPGECVGLHLNYGRRNLGHEGSEQGRDLRYRSNRIRLASPTTVPATAAPPPNSNRHAARSCSTKRK